jgi:rhodanese-related sulfurtransferase
MKQDANANWSDSPHLCIDVRTPAEFRADHHTGFAEMNSL